LKAKEANWWHTMFKSIAFHYPIKIFLTQQNIFHDFSKTTFIFKYFQGLEFAPLKFRDFQGPGDILQIYSRSLQKLIHLFYVHCLPISKFHGNLATIY